MIALSIVPDVEVDGIQFGERLPDTPEVAGVTVGGLSHGTAAGKPSVFIVLHNADGHPQLFAQTTLALFLSAADALKAAHGDPRE